MRAFAQLFLDLDNTTSTKEKTERLARYLEQAPAADAAWAAYLLAGKSSRRRLPRKTLITALQARFPGVTAPRREDICYATTNRQEAVKAIAEGTDLVLVVGAANSSNSVRLVEVALRAGARDARLIADAHDIDFAWLDGARRVGLTAGASAPEDLVQGVIAALHERFEVTVEHAETAREIRMQIFEALERLQEQLLVVGTMTAQEKVREFLSYFHRRLSAGRGDSLALPISRYDIADMLGISAETVCRAFTDLQERGVISLQGPRRIRITRRRGDDDG